jgi:hypothetical protein
MVRTTAGTGVEGCAACGSNIKRAAANYCLVCGKHLADGYEPLDAVRSSYRLHGKSFIGKAETIRLFEDNSNPISQTAWACVVYSMVPYLGILFLPLAIVIGGAGYFAAVRRPQTGGRRLAGAAIGLSLVILAAQAALWWLLYIIPELAV